MVALYCRCNLRVYNLEEKPPSEVAKMGQTLQPNQSSVGKHRRRRHLLRYMEKL